MLIISMLLFATLVAYSAAKLEINAEGKDGWAKSLPTYKFKNYITTFLMGDVQMTGYHVWFTFNPYYGLSKFNKQNVTWHRWIGKVPMLYIIYFSIAILSILLSYVV